MAYQFKVGDTGKTRGGRPYRVLATDLKNAETIVAIIEHIGGDEFATMRFANGHVVADGRPQAGDLIPPAPAVYINVYEDEKDGLWTPEAIYTSRKVADKVAAHVRIGCIRVPLEARFDD